MQGLAMMHMDGTQTGGLSSCYDNVSYTAFS